MGDGAPADDEAATLGDRLRGLYTTKRAAYAVGCAAGLLTAPLVPELSVAGAFGLESLTVPGRAVQVLSGIGASVGAAQLTDHARTIREAVTGADGAAGDEAGEEAADDGRSREHERGRDGDRGLVDRVRGAMTRDTAPYACGVAAGAAGLAVAGAPPAVGGALALAGFGAGQLGIDTNDLAKRALEAGGDLVERVAGGAADGSDGSRDETTDCEAGESPDRLVDREAEKLRTERDSETTVSETVDGEGTGDPDEDSAVDPGDDDREHTRLS